MRLEKVWRGVIMWPRRRRFVSKPAHGAPPRDTTTAPRTPLRVTVPGLYRSDPFFTPRIGPLLAPDRRFCTRNLELALEFDGCRGCPDGTQCSKRTERTPCSKQMEQPSQLETSGAILRRLVSTTLRCFSDPRAQYRSAYVPS